MLSDLIISIYVCIKQKWIPILNWMKNIYHCSKRKKLAIILFTYVSILSFKVAVIGFTHYNNKYDFAVINFDCNSMEVKCGFKNAYSPLSLKVQDMTVELYAQDTQTKSRAVAFKIDEFYFEKSEPMLQNAILIIKSMNNSILFDILTKRKPEVIVRVKAKIRPRFSGIRFMGISINKTHEMKLAKSTPPPCAMYKDFRMEGHDEGYSIATLAINKNYLSFPSWFNIRMKPCVYKFKLPRMSLKVDDFEIRNGVLNKDIKCRIKTDNFQSITSILRQKDENSHIRLEMLKYSGTNELLKRFCNNLTMRFDTGNKSLNAEQDNNAVYYVKLLGFTNRKLSLYTKIADERLKDSLKHFEVLESTKLKFIGYLDNNCPVLSITANFFYKNEIEASVEIEIVNIEKLIEFLYFKKSYLSIALDKNTSLGKVFDSSVLVVDTEGMFTIVNDINNFDYRAEKEKNKIMPKINYAKNVAYEFEHNCTSGENDFSINSVLNFGTYENDTNRIVIDIEEDINICAKADDMTVNFKLERDSRIEVKHKKTLEDGKQEDVPLVDLLTGFMRTELKVSNISLYNRKFITLIEAWYNKRILNANAVNDYKYLALTHCNTIQVEDSPINVEYLMDKADEYSNLDVDETSERVSILNLTQFRLRDKTIEMHIGSEEDLLVNENAIVKESNEDTRYTVYTDSHGKTLQIPHLTQQHVIRHTFCMENRMQFNIYSKNFGFMSLDPCKITFVTSKNGMHNIKCSEPIKYTFADEINLCELMCYITKTSVNEVFLCIDKEKDMLSNFIAKVIAARVSVKALDPQNITYEGTMNNFIDLTINDNIVNFGFSVNFCDKIKSNLEDVFGSINVDIPAFKIVFGGENGHFDFSGAKLLYDNSLRKASLSDFKISASLNMKAVTDYLIFDVKYKSQNVLSETDQLKDILFFARLSKNFKFVNRQKPVTPTEADLQTIINDLKIDSDDDNVVARVSGDIYIQSLFSLFQKFSQKLRLIYRFEPKWVVNEVNIQNIPLFTIFSDETPFFYLVCRKFTGRQAIFTGEKKCQPLKFNTEIVKNLSLMPLERKISFKSSTFLEFITPEPTTESPPNAIHFHPAIIDKGYFMLRLSKYVKFTDNKVHFVYINEDRRSFVLDMSLVQKTEQYWILAKFFDHRHGSSKLSDRTKRTLGFDFPRPRYFYILIDGIIVYGIDLLNPDVDVIPNKKMGLAIKVAQVFGTLLFNLFARWLEPIETKSLYTESDLTESCKTIDEVFKTCTKATRN